MFKFKKKMSTDTTKAITGNNTFSFIKEIIFKFFHLLHFEQNRITVAFTYDDSGLPIIGLSKSDFTATAVQTPSSWVTDERLDIIKLDSKGDGIYTFLFHHNRKKLIPGKWTIIIKVLTNQKTKKVTGNEIVNFTLL